jgi:hypothetical protein
MSFSHSENICATESRYALGTWSRQLGALLEMGVTPIARHRRPVSVAHNLRGMFSLVINSIALDNVPV